jgi:hypothetical protein
MHSIHTLIHVLEGLHEKSPEFFWIVVSSVCVLMTSVLIWASVVEAIKKLRQQQMQGRKSNNRPLLWMRAGGLIALYLALIPVMLVIAVPVCLWVDYRLHVKSS